MKRLLLGLSLLVTCGVSYASAGICNHANVKSLLADSVAETWWVDGFKKDGYDKYTIDNYRFVEQDKGTGMTGCYIRVRFSGMQYNDHPTLGVMYFVKGSKADVVKNDFQLALKVAMPYDTVDW